MKPRLNELLLGAAYYPEHRDPVRWEYDLDQIQDAHVNCLRVGEFAWKRFEPAQGRYEFDWMDRWIGLAARRGIRILMCPPLRTAPAWLVDADPSVKIETADGIRQEFGSRYTFCINNPLLLDRGRAMAEAMARHYGAHPAIVGWHLDNEYGDEADCHCEACRAAFQAWCRARYGTIDALNRAWGMVFWDLELDTFEQLPTPRRTKTHFSPGHILAWRRFRSDCTVRAIEMQAAALRPHVDPEHFVTTNFQSWNRRTDYFDSAEHLDVTGMNVYPDYGAGRPFDSWSVEMCRAYRNANFQVHELRSGPHMVVERAGNTPAPGDIARLALHCVGHGANALLFFRWRGCPFGPEQGHGSITGFDGQPKRSYREIRELFRRLRRLSPVLGPSIVRSEIAVLYAFDSQWLMAANEEWCSPAAFHDAQVRKIYRAARESGTCHMTGTHLPWDAYRVLLVPVLAVIDDATADKMVAFVKAGGTLVLNPLCATRDADGTVYPGRIHPRIAELLGSNVDEFGTAGANEPIAFDWNGKRYTGESFFDLPEAGGMSVRGTFREAWYAGTPAVLERAVGAGRVIQVAVFAESRFYEDLLRSLRPDAAPYGLAGWSIPASVTVCVRVAPDGWRFVFLSNHAAEPVTVGLPERTEDVYADEWVEPQVPIAPLGVRILRVK